MVLSPYGQAVRIHGCDVISKSKLQLGSQGSTVHEGGCERRHAARGNGICRGKCWVKILMLKLQLLTCRLLWTIIICSAAIWIFSSLKLFLPTPPAPPPCVVIPIWFSRFYNEERDGKGRNKIMCVFPFQINYRFFKKQLWKQMSLSHRIGPFLS
jgi:hypothetical protein